MKTIKITLKSLLLLLCLGIFCNNNAMKRDRDDDRLNQAPTKRAKTDDNQTDSQSLTEQLYDTVSLGAPKPMEIEPESPEGISTISNNSLQLKLYDGNIWTIVDFPKHLCALSTTMQNMIDDFPESNDPLPLLNITTEAWNLLQPLFVALDKVKNNEGTAEEIYNKLQSYSVENLVKVINASNFLDVRIKSATDKPDIELIHPTTDIIAQKLLKPENLKQFFTSGTFFEQTGLQYLPRDLSKIIVQKITEAKPQFIVRMLRAQSTFEHAKIISIANKRQDNCVECVDCRFGFSKDGDKIICHENGFKYAVFDFNEHKRLCTANMGMGGITFSNLNNDELIFWDRDEASVAKYNLHTTEETKILGASDYTYYPNLPPEYIPEHEEDRAPQLIGFVTNNDKSKALVVCIDNGDNFYIPKICNLQTHESINLASIPDESDMEHATFNHAGNQLATDQVDNYHVMILNANTGELVHTLSGHNRSITSIEFSNSDELLLTTDKGETARIWDLRDGTCLHSLNMNNCEIAKAKFSKKGNKVILLFDNGQIAFYDIQQNKMSPFAIPNNRFTEIMIDHSNDKLISLSENGAAQLWNIENGTFLKSFRLRNCKIVKAILTSSGDNLITLSDTGEAHIWDTKTGAWTTRFNDIPDINFLAKTNDQIHSLCLNPTEDKIIIFFHNYIAIIDLLRRGETYLKKNLKLDQALLLVCWNMFINNRKIFNQKLHPQHVKTIFATLPTEIKKGIVQTNKKIFAIYKSNNDLKID